MTMTTDPDENAFPCHQGQDFSVREWGLTKREYIATSIMQGLITGVRASGDGLNIKELSESTILITDALIKELNKNK